MRRTLALTLCLLIAACATPRERCEAASTRDLRVLDSLIAESRATLSRGYGFERQTVVRTHLEPCRRGNEPFLFCTYDEVREVRRPVAVDLEVERRKLASLEAKRGELVARAARGIAACREAFPAE